MGWFAPALSGSNTLLPASPLMYPGNDHPGISNFSYLGLYWVRIKLEDTRNEKLSPMYYMCPMYVTQGPLSHKGSVSTCSPESSSSTLPTWVLNQSRWGKGDGHGYESGVAVYFFSLPWKTKSFAKKQETVKYRLDAGKKKKIFLYFTEFNPRIIFIYTSII